MDDINPFVVFEVKLDKDRGIIVITVRKEEHDAVHFFRFHHQPLNCHPEQLQHLIRSQNVTSRTKSITVNIYGYLAHYWNEEKKYFEFKGVKLNSTVQQLQKVQSIRINKEVGILRRKAAAKDRKQAELILLKEKNKEFENNFQIERAKRIAEAVIEINKKKSENLQA